MFKKEHEIFVRPEDLATMISIMGSCLGCNKKYYVTQCDWADDEYRFSIVFRANQKEMDDLRIQVLKMEVINHKYHKYVVAIEEEACA